MKPVEPGSRRTDAPAATTPADHGRSGTERNVFESLLDGMRSDPLTAPAFAGPAMVGTQEVPPAAPLAPSAQARAAVEEMLAGIRVSEKVKAGHHAVVLQLKGRSLAGTTVSIVRHGNRVDFDIVPVSMDAYRLLRGELGALFESLAGLDPALFVDVQLRPPVARPAPD